MDFSSGQAMIPSWSATALGSAHEGTNDVRELEEEAIRQFTENSLSVCVGAGVWVGENKVTEE